MIGDSDFRLRPSSKKWWSRFDRTSLFFLINSILFPPHFDRQTIKSNLSKIRIIVELNFVNLILVVIFSLLIILFLFFLYHPYLSLSFFTSFLYLVIDDRRNQTRNNIQSSTIVIVITFLFSHLIIIERVQLKLVIFNFLSSSLLSFSFFPTSLSIVIIETIQLKLATRLNLYIFSIAVNEEGRHDLMAIYVYSLISFLTYISLFRPVHGTKHEKNLMIIGIPSRRQK